MASVWSHLVHAERNELAYRDPNLKCSPTRLERYTAICHWRVERKKRSANCETGLAGQLYCQAWLAWQPAADSPKVSLGHVLAHHASHLERNAFGANLKNGKDRRLRMRTQHVALPSCTAGCSSGFAMHKTGVSALPLTCLPQRW